ncbi:hypothetical protein FOZG_18276 [Fusarium oxysporum Fo47]|uniref:Uncharacterized protein n=1 Tax=Fusarium oxysporum Fo47 TaxID=660027 RepID=W9JEX5_FUSOX|nr:hypothetical protein FOZG_18276 [Fusarium oxysporum Fo47]
MGICKVRLRLPAGTTGRYSGELYPSQRTSRGQPSI